MVSRTDGDPPLPPFPPSPRVSVSKASLCRFKTSPCVRAPRPHVVTHVLAHAIEMRKVLEEEERRKEEEQKKAARSSASSAPKRTRKKRRKRRLPRGVRIRRCGHGLRSRSSLSGACSASWPVCARRTVARSSSISAVACARLVLLVTMLLVPCFLLLTTGPRCSTSWPVRTRRTFTSTLVACLAGFAGDSAHRAVLLSLSSGPRCSVSWSAVPPLGVHHGRYGPEEQLRRYWWHVWLVLLVTLHIALCFFPCRQGQDALHLGRYGSEGLACLPGRQHPCPGAEAFPMVQTCSGQGGWCPCCACVPFDCGRPLLSASWSVCLVRQWIHILRQQDKMKKRDKMKRR